MYRLLLVDDEPEIREGLREVVDFASLGFEVVGEAGTGLDALRIADALSPDLVITDIRMPLMDGLTMARQMSKTLTTVRFVILSGYDDFEYARQAIEIPTMGYVLKPISAAEFTEMLRGVRAKLDEEFERRRDVNRLRADFDASLPLLRQMLLTSLLSGETDADEAKEASLRYRMALESPAYALALIRQPAAAAQDAQPAIPDPELRAFAIGNIAGEFLDQRARHYLFRHGGMIATLLLLPDEKDAFSKALDALEEMRRQIVYYVGAPILIGVSAAASSLSELPVCARQAVSALNHGALMAASQVLCVTDLEPGIHGAPVIDDYALNRLSAGLKLGESEQARQAVLRLLEACAGKPANLTAYRTCLLEILMVFIRTARDLALRAPALDQQMTERMEQFMLCPPVGAAADALEALIGAFTAQVRETRASSTVLLSQQATEYIRAHYAEDDLTVEKVSRALHVSTSYFSALFKKETRKTFVQFLTELRMDEAAKLLASTDMTTAQIASSVGVGDPSYFSYSFKKHFGMPPSQARGRRRPT